MYNEDFPLLKYSDQVRYMTRLFTLNKATLKEFGKNLSLFTEKYPRNNANKGFKLSLNTSDSFNRCLLLMRAINDLSENLPEIKTKKFDNTLPQRFYELSGIASELYIKIMESYRDYELETDTVRQLPNEDFDFLENSLYRTSRDHCHTARNELALFGTSLTNNLVEKSSRNTESRNKIKLKISAPFEWGSITIKVKEGGQDIEIFQKKEKISTLSYIELGFVTGTKNAKPNRQWQLLYILSVLSETDIENATPEKLSNSMSKYANKKINSVNIHSIKKELSKSLKNLFETEHDPFYSKDYYQPKFKLLPTPDLRYEEIWTQKNQDIDKLIQKGLI